MSLRSIGAVVVAAVAVVVFVSTLAHATLYSAPDEVSAPVYTAATAGTPLKLRIPSLGVNAAVQRVGVAKSGNLAVPTNFTDVGWYRGGVEPGQVGSAVMDGHVDNGLGVPAVFKNISTLHAGDTMFVDNASGTLRFVVQNVSVYARDSVPLGQVFSSTDAARLTLITCEGEWLQDQKTYDHRVVVYAVLQP